MNGQDVAEPPDGCAPCGFGELSGVWAPSGPTRDFNGANSELSVVVPPTWLGSGNNKPTKGLVDTPASCDCSPSHGTALEEGMFRFLLRK